MSARPPASWMEAAMARARSNDSDMIRTKRLAAVFLHEATAEPGRDCVQDHQAARRRVRINLGHRVRERPGDRIRDLLGRLPRPRRLRDPVSRIAPPELLVFTLSTPRI